MINHISCIYVGSIVLLTFSYDAENLGCDKILIKLLHRNQHVRFNLYLVIITISPSYQKQAMVDSPNDFVQM